jgi:phosphocarrier protein
MVTRSATVRNEYGIHCRPASLIAREALSYPGAIAVRTASGQANAKSVLEMVSLAAGCGEQVAISVKGPDEEAVVQRFVALFETHFEFSK